MGSQFEKELNRELENGINSFINGLVKYSGIFFKGAWKGVKKLKDIRFLIGFIVCFAIAGLTRMNSKVFLEETEFMYKILYVLLLLNWLIYLFAISKVKDKVDKTLEKFSNGFQMLNLVGLDGELPKVNYINRDEESGFVEYSFKSLVPIEVWEKNKSNLETVMNISIFSITQGDDMQTVIINSIDGTAKIQEKLLWSDEYIKNEGVITLGRNAVSEIQFDFNKAPHVLAAGETGSGKSVILRSILWQMLNQGADVIMVDFKGGIEFGLEYEKVGEVITEIKRADEVFSYLVKENEKRMKLIRESNCKNIHEYNRIPGREKFRRIGVFIDEMAQLMDSKGADDETKALLKKIEGNVATLARLSRATGINLILGLQRPDANVLPGQIKNNIPVRICGRFADEAASKIVLNNTRATKLKDIKGRFLFKVGADTIEFQSYYFDDEKHFDISKLNLDKKEVEKTKEELIEESNKDLIVDVEYEETTVESEQDNSLNELMF